MVIEIGPELAETIKVVAGFASAAVVIWAIIRVVR